MSDIEELTKKCERAAKILRVAINMVHDGRGSAVDVQRYSKAYGRATAKLREAVREAAKGP